MVVIVLFVNETLVYATKEEYYNKSIAEKDKANFYNLTMDDGLSNNKAFHGSLRGEKTMIRVLFVCHGRIYRA